jgi:uncharacterized delta-60 repeat protein
MKRLLAILGTVIEKNISRTPEPNRSRNGHWHALFLGCLLAASLLAAASRGYAGTQATVFTDKSDYLPGSTAWISGEGFEPAETVVLQVLHADGRPSDGADHEPWPVAADANGSFQSTWHVCEDDCVGSTLSLSASGQTSGLSAEAFFTDAGPSTGGELDPTFDFGSSVNDSVRSVIALSDGKTLIGGYFTTVNGAVCGRIARLNADGSTDTTFQSGLAGANNGIQSTILQPDGKILIGGFFTTVNGAARNRVARLNSDGTLDTTFQDPGADNQINSIAVQPDGKVLIVGSFANVSGIPRANLARLNSDGTLDTSFLNGMSGANNGVLSVTVQPDGKILIGGFFTMVNNVTHTGLARLNSDGSVDASFLDGMNGPQGAVYTIALQPDGKVLIGGDFLKLNFNIDGAVRPAIARLNSDGSRDTSFVVTGVERFREALNPGTTVFSIVVEPNGDILYGGRFSSLNGDVQGFFGRLNSGGGVDFDVSLSPPPQIITGNTVNQTVNALALQPDGKVLLGGDFITTDTIMPRNRIARVNSDGSLDAAFQNGPAGPERTVRSVAVQANGKILIAGNFVGLNGDTTLGGGCSRLNIDGSRDTTFPGLTGSTNISCSVIAIQADGKVVIGGSFFLTQQSVNRIGRFNSDGSVDITFASPAGGVDNTVSTLAFQPDGKILIGGIFNNVSFVGRNRIARLNSDGSLDTGFLNGLAGANNTVNAIALQPDGKVLIGGAFTSLNGVARNRIARLNSDGTIDTGFLNGLAGANNVINCIALQPDGKILIGGTFTSVNGTGRNRLARLNSNGSLDTTFLNGMAAANGTVNSFAVQCNGQVLIGGAFSTINGVGRNRIARLNSGGSLDTTFLNGLTGPNATVFSVAVQADDNVLIAGDFTIINGVARDKVARLMGAPVFTPPTISCPQDVIVAAAAGQCSAVVNYSIVAQADPCSSVTTSSTPPSGSTFQKGTTTVNCTATDTSGKTASCSFTVTVVNDPPVANPQSLTTSEDMPLGLTLTASDVNDPVLTLTGVSNPAHGTLSGVAPNLTYSPALNYNGPDSFTFSVSDGCNAPSTGTIIITVTPVNDPPVALLDNVTIDEDTTLVLQPAAVLANDTDPDVNDVLTIESLDITGTLGTVAFNADGAISYVPAAAFQSLATGETASDSFAYTISDGHGGTAVGRVNVTVTGVNDDPVAVADYATVAEDSSNNFINVLANDTDIDASDMRTIIAVSASAHGMVSFTTSGATYTPGPNYFGSDSFTYTISDGHGGSAVGTVNVTVTPVNDAPVASNGAATTPEDTSVEITLQAADVENDALSFAIVAAPAHGVLGTVGGNKVTYMPAPNYNGPDSFMFKANDGTDDSNVGTVSITVNPVDDTPILTNPGDRSDNIGAAISLQLEAVDLENDPLTYNTSGLPQGLSINPQSGLISGNLQGSSNMVYHVTISVSDGTLTDSKTFEWTVINPNHPPVASNGSITTAQNTPVQVTLGATDPDDDALTYSIVNGPGHGTLGPVSGNKVVYTPAPSYSGPDSFTFQASDGKGGTASATITVTVSGPPPSSPGAKVTGGGTINGRGGKSNFGFEVLVTGNGRLQGNLTYHDSAANEIVKAISISALTVSPDCKHGTIYGVATVNGQGAYNFVADLDDFAEPGANVDAFRIQLNDGYVAGGTVTTGGNNQVHCK